MSSRCILKPEQPWAPIEHEVDSKEWKDEIVRRATVLDPERFSGLEWYTVIHRQHHDDKDSDLFDEVLIYPQERWKSSYLSGDEWRVSRNVEFRWKGIKLFTRGAWSTKDALASGYVTYDKLREGYHDALKEAGINQRDYCDQPACCSKATLTYVFRNLFNHDGMVDRDEVKHRVYYTRFCRLHSGRGDCGLEDADGNYILVDGDLQDQPVRDVKVAFQVNGRIRRPENSFGEVELFGPERVVAIQAAVGWLKQQMEWDEATVRAILKEHVL